MGAVISLALLPVEAVLMGFGLSIDEFIASGRADEGRLAWSQTDELPTSCSGRIPGVTSVSLGSRGLHPQNYLRLVQTISLILPMSRARSISTVGTSS